jgi:hypothetical protein
MAASMLLLAMLATAWGVSYHYRVLYHYLGCKPGPIAAREIKLLNSPCTTPRKYSCAPADGTLSELTWCDTEDETDYSAPETLSSGGWQISWSNDNTCSGLPSSAYWTPTGVCFSLWGKERASSMIGVCTENGYRQRGFKNPGCIGSPEQEAHPSPNRTNPHCESFTHSSVMSICI